MKKERKALKASILSQNDGQISWLPKNPRQWTQTDIDNTAASIREDEDFLEDRPLLVVPDGKKYVVFAGNLRLAGGKQEKLAVLPCVVYYPETDTDFDTVKRRALKDNGSFGQWDYDELANSWDDFPLVDFGIPAWPQDGGGFSGGHGGGDGEGDGLGEEEKPKEPKEKIEFVEELLKEAMRENVREATEQIEYTMKRGWIASFFTKGAAQAKFLRAKYYGERYPQYLSLYFCPERFFTSGCKISCYDQFKKIADGADYGIAGLRTVSGDNLLLLLLKGSYPFGGARMPMDFPAVKARELIEEFGGRKGCTVLDPCHGWGGATMRRLNGRCIIVLRSGPESGGAPGIGEGEGCLPSVLPGQPCGNRAGVLRGHGPGRARFRHGHYIAALFRRRAIPRGESVPCPVQSVREVGGRLLPSAYLKNVRRHPARGCLCPPGGRPILSPHRGWKKDRGGGWIHGRGCPATGRWNQVCFT